jgi:predicted outer membrane protein
MLRRTALGALTAAAVTPLMIRTAAAQSAATGQVAQLRQQILGASTFSLNTSEMALQKAQMPAVKTFAQFEANEQRATMEAMKLAGLTIPSEVPMDAQKMQMMQQLRTLDGTQFDRMYLQGQTLGHQELLQLHQQLLTAGTQSEQVIATLSIASIQQHIAMLQAIA